MSLSTWVLLIALPQAREWPGPLPAGRGCSSTRVAGGGRLLPPSALMVCAPRSASVERERSALRAAPGIASALCGSVSLCFFPEPK